MSRDPESSCSTRFEALLALDHSRKEPWGSRHGLAFSAYALQHPEQFLPGAVQRAWLFLYAVYVQGSEPGEVASALRRHGKSNPDWTVPPLPARLPFPSYSVTIVDLGDFDADTYPEKLDAWCRAVLTAWGGEAG